MQFNKLKKFYERNKKSIDLVYTLLNLLLILGIIWGELANNTPIKFSFATLFLLLSAPWLVTAVSRILTTIKNSNKKFEAGESSFFRHLAEEKKFSNIRWIFWIWAVGSFTALGIITLGTASILSFVIVLSRSFNSIPSTSIFGIVLSLLMLCIFLMFLWSIGYLFPRKIEIMNYLFIGLRCAKKKEDVNEFIEEILHYWKSIPRSFLDILGKDEIDTIKLSYAYFVHFIFLKPIGYKEARNLLLRIGEPWKKYEFLDILFVTNNIDADLQEKYRKDYECLFRYLQITHRTEASGWLGLFAHVSENKLMRLIRGGGRHILDFIKHPIGFLIFAFFVLQVASYFGINLSWIDKLFNAIIG